MAGEILAREFRDYADLKLFDSDRQGWSGFSLGGPHSRNVSYDWNFLASPGLSLKFQYHESS